MKSARTVSTTLGFLLVLCSWGCASKPTEQMRLAEQAMKEAEGEHAAEFAPADWQHAKEAWDEAQKLISKESYAGAGSLLLKAKSRFEKARDISKAKRADLRKEIERDQARIDSRYSTLKAAMQSARLSRSVKEQLEDACGEIDKINEKLSTDLAQGEYTRARDTCQEILRQIFEAEKVMEKAR